MNSICDKFFKHYKLKIVGNSSKGYEVLLPICILDTMQTLLFKEVIPYITHKIKKASSDLRKQYHLYNSEFFRIYTTEERDYIIDNYMDEFQRGLFEDIPEFRRCIENPISDMTDEDKHLFSAIDCCHLLIDIADKIWKKTFENVPYMSGGNQYIKEMLRLSEYMYKEFFRNHSHMTLNQDDDIELHSQLAELIGKSISFINYLDSDQDLTIE